MLATAKLYQASDTWAVLGRKGKDRVCLQLRGPECMETACADHKDNHEPEQKAALTGCQGEVAWLRG